MAKTPMESKAAAEAEAVCLRQIALGDRAAFETMYRSWQPRVYRYLARLLGDEPAAEEVGDDVLFEVWKRAREFRGDSRVSTWIFGIAHHRAMSHLRKLRVEWEPVGETVDTGSDAEQALIERAGREALHAALRQLPPAQREVLWLTFFEEMSYQEIARIAGCPEATVKTRVFYAKKGLAGLLRQRGAER